MRRARIAWACVVAMLALCALGTSGAAALEIGRCVASPGTGKYKNATCTKRAGTNAEEKAFEFVKNAVKKQFKMAGGIWLIGTASEAPGKPLEWLASCNHQSGSGEYRETGATPSTKAVQHVQQTWTECEIQARNIPTPVGTPCESAGQASGTIVSSSLTGKLGYISKETGHPPVVGLELHPESKLADFMGFECGGLKVVSHEGGSGGHGCVIGQFSSPDEMSEFFFLNYAARIVFEPFEQVPHLFYKSTHTCVLESNLPDPFLIVGGSTITNEEPLEIKA